MTSQVHAGEDPRKAAARRREEVLRNARAGIDAASEEYLRELLGAGVLSPALSRRAARRLAAIEAARLPRPGSLSASLRVLPFGEFKGKPLMGVPREALLEVLALLKRRGRLAADIRRHLAWLDGSKGQLGNSPVKARQGGGW